MRQGEVGRQTLTGQERAWRIIINCERELLGGRGWGVVRSSVAGLKQNARRERGRETQEQVLGNGVCVNSTPSSSIPSGKWETNRITESEERVGGDS